MFAGSPYSPRHTAQRRRGYFLTGATIAVVSGFPNALTNVNVGTIAGSLGLYAAEAAVLPAIYVAMNACANLSLVKARAQFGIPQVTGTLLAVHALTAALQFARSNLVAAILVRAVSGMAAAALLTLGIYYLMQSMPAKARPLGAVIGIALPQLGTPLARLVPIDTLAEHGWWGLHAIELAVPLAILVLVLMVPLPPSDRSRAFEPLDLLTIALAGLGMTLLCVVIGLGRTLWWTDTPWLGVALAIAVPLLTLAFLIETHRPRPLLHFEWIGTGTMLRFATVALLIRLALGEQSFAAVGLLSTFGLNSDQFHSLFLRVALAMLCGVATAALTLSEHRIPWQVMIASLIIAAGAWMDSDANALTRPEQLYASQMLIGFGTTLFIGPALLYGLLRMLQRGGDHLVTCVVLFSTTQNVGGLLGSALLGSFQTIATRNASNVLAGDLAIPSAQVATRLASSAGALGSVLLDPAQRTGQAGAQLGQVMARESAVIAYADVSRLVTGIALATALFVALNIGLSAWRRREHRA